MAAGDFTATAEGAKILKEDQLLTTSRMSELKQSIVGGQAILNHQDPVFENVGMEAMGEACINTKVYTLRSGSLDAGDKTITCAVRGAVQPESEALTLAKEQLVNPQGFFIKDIHCKNAADFGSQLAYMGMKAKIQLEVKLAQALVAKAVTGIDLPVLADWETTAALNGSILEVATANFTSDIFADIQAVGQIRDLNDPIILNGRNLYNTSILQQYESNGCCSNDAILNRNNVFDIFWDLKNVDSITGAASTLVIDKNSLLFWSSPAYDNIGMGSAESEGKEAGDRMHWVETLPRFQYWANGGMQPIYVDIRAERSCVQDTLGVARDGWKFDYMLFGALALNLQNQEGLNGIYQINKVA